VAFAEIERFLDTPVKHYSSGMYVRLAFAVAAHLDPEILLVDEVLAVGDAAFQKKCLGKMGEVAGEGRTVLFVSHNMAAVQHLCHRAILLNDGELILDDTAVLTASHYIDTASNAESRNGRAYTVRRTALESEQHPDMQITTVALYTPSQEPLTVFYTGEPLVLRIQYQACRQFTSQAFSVHINNQLGQRVVQLNTTPISGYPITRLGRSGYLDLVIDSLPLTAGRYYFDVGFVRERTSWIIKLEEVIALDVSSKDVYGSGMALDNSRGMIVVQHHWTHHHCDEP
jgi:lipopolysaccharide transport system ATP-binding protein